MEPNTKIVATYGPAVASAERLTGIVRAGADVIRLNFSHGDFADHEKAIRMVRQVSDDLGKSVAILQDLRGPKIRVGTIADEPLNLEEGQTVTLAVGSDAADAIPVDGHPQLGEDVKPGEIILLDDGKIRLRARRVDGQRIVCDVLTSGPLTSRKGVNFPETHLRTIEMPTQKDWQDLEFGLKQGVDIVALSFVRIADDVERLKKRIAAAGSDVPVVAKIEKREALENLDAIIDVADGVMVARGDLGVETELEEVTLRQKEIIRACNRQGRVVITATQMLESMIHQLSPTRAEVADISNAIFDGTDAIMLSAETSIGEHPEEAVAMMRRIAERTEAALDVDRTLARRPYLSDVADAVAHAACVLATEIKARAMICITRSGLTGRLVSRYRPRCPVIACSPVASTVRRLALVWGLVPLQLDGEQEDDVLIAHALSKARARGVVRDGDKIVITAGISTGVLRGKTNLIRVEVL